MSSGSGAVPHLVVGEDAFALARFLRLRARHGPGAVALLGGRRADPAALLGGPGFLRGAASVRAVRGALPGVPVLEEGGGAAVLREGRWRPLDGARRRRLPPGEEGYAGPRARIDLGRALPPLGDPEALRSAVAAMVRDEAVGVREVREGGAPLHELVLAGGRRVRCRRLHWGLGPWRFLSLHDRGGLDDALVRFCGSVRPASSLVLDLVLDGPVTDDGRTLFIPVSQSRDLGHFMGEFTEGGGGRARAVFTVLVDPDEDDEEGVARKIRLFRRLAARAFPGLESRLVSERVALGDEPPAAVDDALFHASASAAGGRLSFVGQGGVVEGPAPPPGVSHLARGLLSVPPPG